jgi:hypothetical protein
MRRSWFSFMAVRSSRRLICILSIMISSSFISFSSSMSSAQAGQGFPSKMSHRSGRRIFVLHRLPRSAILILIRLWTCCGPRSMSNSISSLLRLHECTAYRIIFVGVEAIYLRYKKEDGSWTMDGSSSSDSPKFSCHMTSIAYVPPRIMHHD